MKGLILKDYYISKKFLIIGSCGFLLGDILLYLFRFSFIYGNFRNLSIEELASGIKTTDLVLPVVAGLIFLFAVVAGTDNSIYKDNSSGWFLHLFSSHISAKEIAGAKYTQFAFLWLTGLIASLINMVIYGLVFGFRYVAPAMVIFYIIAALISLIQCIILPMAYRYRNQNAVIGRLLIICIIPAMAVLVLVSNKFETLLENAHPILFLRNHSLPVIGIATAVIIVSFVISYKRSVKLLERKELFC